MILEEIERMERKLNNILINQGLLAGMIQTVAISAGYPPGSDREMQCMKLLEKHSETIYANIKEFENPKQGEIDGKA